MKKLAKVLYRFRFWWSGVVVGTTILFALLIKIETDNSLKVWFSANDPDYLVYEKCRDVFEGGRYLIVSLQSDNIFSPDILKFIKEKTAYLENFPQAKSVHSLANANKIIGTTDGIEINPLLSNLKKNNLPRIKKYALEDDLFKDYLVSSDGKFTTIIIAFEEMSSEKVDETVSQVEEIIERGKPENLEISFSGDMEMMREFNYFTRQNQKIFPFLVLPLICLFIFILFRSWYKNFIILLVVGMSLCCTLGFYSILGYTFNVVTGMLIPLIIILSIADGVHIMKYFDEIIGQSSKRETFVNTLEHITLPCFITSITTSCGLLSLAISPIDAVKQFGIGAAAGIMFAFLISIIIVPVCLNLFPVSQQRQQNERWKGFLDKIDGFNQKSFKYILVGAMLTFIFFAWGITKIKIETNQIEWFPKKGVFYKSAMLVNKKLCGIGDMTIVIKGEEGLLKEPDILKRIDRLSSDIKQLPMVKKVISLADYVKMTNKALKEDNSLEYKIPDSKDLIAQELFLFTFSDEGREELDKIVAPDYSQGKISIKIESMPSQKSVLLANLMEEMARDIFLGTETSVFLTGTLYLYNLMNEYLLMSQIRGFSLAFLLVCGILFIAFRSIKYGVLSVVANLFPIVSIIGIMGWFGITLNTGTVMVASVALGIAVDDTIHFISRFRRELKFNRTSIPDTLRKTTVSVGIAVISTSIINMAGFLILLISGFQPTREFGLLIALTLFFALIGDLLILPASIMASRKFLIPRDKEWK